MPIFAACCEQHAMVLDDMPFNPSTHLTMSDVLLNESAERRNISLQIEVSKTDQLCKGTTIFLGSTIADLCSVAALLDLFAVQGFSPGLLFQLEDGNL